jgi:SAM-dependent methyltransferase
MTGPEALAIARVDAAGRRTAVEIAQAIRAGSCPSDEVFDRFLPRALRPLSRRHWTPVSIALRVAGWLEDQGVRTVVDLGSGSGKFCVAAALASRCSFVGIEERPRFVAASRTLARRFGVADRVRFVNDVLDIDAIPMADAYYLYNPFEENVVDVESRIGDDIELGPVRYVQEIVRVEQFLKNAPEGTVVVEFHGFGGTMPDAYDILFHDEVSNELRMWRKRSPELVR